MTQKTKKILILSTAYLPLVGGSEIAIKEITDRLPGYDFDLITARSSPAFLKEEKIGNVNVFRVGSKFNLLSFLLPKNFLPLAIFFKALDLIKNNGPYDLVHAFQASQAAGATWLLKFLYPQLPVLLTLQEGQNLEKQNFFKKFFRKLIIKKADQATAISQYLKNYILSLRKNMQVSIIPNGVDFENFSRDFSYGELSGLADNLNIKPDEKVIVTTGRLVPKNGIDSLIKSFAILHHGPVSTDNQYKLLIVGEGPQKVELQNLAEQLGVREKVVFAGMVSHESLPKYLKISHVFIRPSRSEGLGNSFLEAMAASLPVIGSRIGGIPDFITHGETGIFCDPLKPEDIAAKINLVVGDNDLRKKIAVEGRKLVREKYHWEKIAQEYRNIYETFNRNPSL